MFLMEGIGFTGQEVCLSLTPDPKEIKDSVVTNMQTMC